MPPLRPTLQNLLAKASRRSRRAVRRASARARPLAGSAVRMARKAPVPPRVREGLARRFLRHPGVRPVPVDRLLLGAQNAWGNTATDFAEQTGWLLWPSTPVTKGPHVQFLRNALHSKEPLSDEEILASPYGQLGLRCIEQHGRYFAATDAAGLVAGARAFLAMAKGHGSAPSGPDFSRPQDPILVAPVRDSDCYQIIDGHHRVAIAVAQGRDCVDVTVSRLSVRTPLQNLLTRMSWIDGANELYQPVDAPELQSSWTTVRRCDDRLTKMTALLGQRGMLHPATSSYLDVASCYGWFVAAMRDLGYDAEGIERDPLARPLGEAVYGLDPTRIRIGSAEDLLLSADRTWDVTSCFSLLHHFVLGRASVSAEELLRRLDKVTGQVLFLDTGEGHEQWFATSLRDWDTEHIRRFVLDNTTFEQVIDLGPDLDAVPPYGDNYGRHLFACVRGEQ